MPRDSLTPDEVVALIGRSNATLLDIGANLGDFSNDLGKLFPYGQVFAFEPDPRAIEKFKKTVRCSNVHLIPKAVGRHDGTVTFHQSSGSHPGTTDGENRATFPDGWDQSSSIRRPKAHLDAFPWVKFDGTIDVEAITLDAWAAQSGVRFVDFIWADVQGAEEDLIAGGPNTLAEARYLYTEFSAAEMYEGAPNLDRIVSLLPGFEVVEVFLHDVLLRNTRSLAMA